MTTWIDQLNQYRPCSDAFKWARQFDTFATAWAVCERGDWMLWIIGKTLPHSSDRTRIVMAACECARLALPYTNDPRVLRCIEATEAWTRGEVTIEQVREARAAAYSAAYAAAYAYAADAAYSAAYAAYSAAYAAYSAAYAASSSAYAAAYAAAAAASADAASYAYAAAASADAASYAYVPKQCADIIRKHYPEPPTL